MKHTLYIVMLLFLLAAIGFVSISFMGPNTSSQHGQIQSVALPAALVGFPDIEHVPVYPDAAVRTAGVPFNGYTRPVTATGQGIPDVRHLVTISYEVQGGADRVHQFYEEALREEGWLFQSSFGPPQPGIQSQYAWFGQTRLYSWNDPEGQQSWGLYLELKLDMALDESNTLVSLNYGRYPVVNRGLPLYTDAESITTTRSEREQIFASGKVPVHVTDITYSSAAPAEQITQFYDERLLKDGWYFFDRSGAGEVANQTGDISSPEGLYFRGGHPGWDDVRGYTGYQLFITSTRQQDGHSTITLHLEESGTSGQSP